MVNPTQNKTMLATAQATTQLATTQLLREEIEKKQSEVESIDHKISHIRAGEVIQKKEMEVKELDQKIAKVQVLAAEASLPGSGQLVHNSIKDSSNSETEPEPVLYI